MLRMRFWLPEAPRMLQFIFKRTLMDVDTIKVRQSRDLLNKPYYEHFGKRPRGGGGDRIQHKHVPYAHILKTTYT